MSPSSAPAVGMAGGPGSGMGTYPLVGLSRDGHALLRVRDASTWRRRLRGLQGHPALATDEALWIRPCWSVQGWHMSYPIDLVFLDRQGGVRKLARLAPGGMALCLRASSVIEMAAGSIARLGLSVGDVLVADGTIGS